MKAPTYDPATCITADELRAMDIPVPANVPDCGWTRRGAMRMKSATHAGTQDDIDAGVLRMNIEIEFTEPFRWVDFKVLVEKA